MEPFEEVWNANEAVIITADLLLLLLPPVQEGGCLWHEDAFIPPGHCQEVHVKVQVAAHNVVIECPCAQDVKDRCPSAHALVPCRVVHGQ